MLGLSRSQDRQVINVFFCVTRVNQLLMVTFACQTYDTSRQGRKSYRECMQM